MSPHTTLLYHRRLVAFRPSRPIALRVLSLEVIGLRVVSAIFSGDVLTSNELAQEQTLVLRLYLKDIFDDG